jgi:hypothetical protein
VHYNGQSYINDGCGVLPWRRNPLCQVHQTELFHLGIAVGEYSTTFGHDDGVKPSECGR